MYPILLSTPYFVLYSYGIALLLGLLVTLGLSFYFTRPTSRTPNPFYRYGIWLLLGIFIGSRLYYVLPQLSFYWGDPLLMLRFFDDPLNIFGSIFGLLITLVIVTRRHRKLPTHLDIAAILLAVWFVFLRCGNLLAGTYYGTVTEQPWGLIINSMDFPFAGVMVHPLAVYDIIFLLILLPIMLRTFRSSLAAGATATIGGGVYAVYYILIHPLHHDAVFYHDHNVDLVLAIFLLLVTGLSALRMLLQARRRSKRTVAGKLRRAYGRRDKAKS